MNAQVSSTIEPSSRYGRVSHDGSRWAYDTMAIHASRFLTLAAIIYATWHYGAADTTALCNLSWILGAALMVALSCKQVRSTQRHRLPVFYFALILGWIGYAIVQQTTIAAWIPGLFGEVTHVHQQWGAESTRMLGDAMKGLQETSPKIHAEGYASVAPEVTRQALVPFLLAGAMAILSTVLFTSRSSRRVFLWTVIVNAAALAFWGIIQRSSRADEILPGIENTFSSGIPFASFIYKNAGAATLLPALAGVVAILYARSGNSRKDSRSRNHWGTKPALLDTSNLVLLSLGILLICGLATSLSRGAWFAAILATVAVAPLCGITIRKWQHLIAPALIVFAVCAVIAVAGVRQTIQQHRDANVSLQRVIHDSRWSQWIDGFSTALQHFPSGSGLGTYGYASLPNLSSPRIRWFREAHNQYLEIFTESGLIGITILVAGICWFALCSWRLRSRRYDRERRSWGIVGIALLICGGTQSIFDFVLVIPANLILYASAIGIIGAMAQTSRRSRNASTSADSGRSSAVDPLGMLRFANTPAVWCGIALLLVTMSYRAASQQRFSEKALASTSVAQIEAQPDQAIVTARIAQLGTAIEQQIHNADLYQRRANWHLAAYRLEVMNAAGHDHVPIDWATSRLENLFAAVYSQTGDDRTELIDGLQRTPEMRSALANAAADLSNACAFAPLSPRVHLTGCVISPLIGMPTKPWLESTSTLSNNSAEILFLNGLLSFYFDDMELAVDQWSRSLSLNHQFLHPIFELSRQRLPAMQIAANLIPSDRPDLYVRLLETGHASQSDGESSGTVEEKRALSDSLIDHIHKSEQIESSLKHATIAKIRRFQGDNDGELQSWEAALKVQSRDPNYRLEYSQSLSRAGRNDEALKQAVLGRTLNPTDRRFEQLTSRIRQEIRLQKRR